MGAWHGDKTKKILEVSEISRDSALSSCDKRNMPEKSKIFFHQPRILIFI
jgi:hypothetical protein